MRIVVQIVPDAQAAARLHAVAAAMRADLARAGVLLPETPGMRGHGLLPIVVEDPARPSAAACAQGETGAAAQSRLRTRLRAGLEREIAHHAPTVLLLSNGALAALDDAGIGRLAAFLRPLSQDITVIAHWDDPARLMAAHYAEAMALGRTRPLTQELDLADAADLRAAAFATRPEAATDEAGAGPTRHPEAEAAPPWLDLAGFVAAWQAHLPVSLRSLDRAALWGGAAAGIVAADAGLAAPPRPAAPENPPATPPAAWLTRCRRFNAVLDRLATHERLAVPIATRRKLLAELAVAGPPIDPGSLAPLSRRFSTDRAKLLASHPALAEVARVPPAAPWHEADPKNGFRETQYLAAFLPRIRRAGTPTRTDGPPALSDGARRLLPDAARARVAELAGGRLAPHDDFGPPPAETPAFPAGRAPDPGRVVVACLKDEAPYLLDWIAHHRAIGFGSFLIYSNDCTDGTDRMLERLAAMGVVHHRPNSDWTGKSPQQHALNRAVSDPVVTDADWVAHFDVDEYVNIHAGDGTLDALFAAVPDATHVAMPWRLFGHCGVERIADTPVTEQFTRAAPRWCPKPHTVWGIKTLGRNLGVYARLACHRPNRPDTARLDAVRWVNGAGRDVTSAYATGGWRATRDTIGYALVQLNHYALRSLDAFLVKRARGRALHVDRQIGLNYWIRMDWSDHEDRSILRNRPRTATERARLAADPVLAGLHAGGLAWHRDRAAALRADPAFAALARDAAAIRLTPLERVAWALSNDTES